MTRIKKLSTVLAKELISKLDLSEDEAKAMDICLVLSTDMWAGFVDDGLAALWGIMPPTILSGQAYMWMWTTNLMTEHLFLLVRHSQLAVEEALKLYPSIVGHVTIGNNKAIKWLRWLGATFGELQGSGIPFRITKESFKVRAHG